MNFIKLGKRFMVEDSNVIVDEKEMKALTSKSVKPLAKIEITEIEGTLDDESRENVAVESTNIEEATNGVKPNISSRRK